MKITEYYLQEKNRFAPLWGGHSGPFSKLKDAKARVAEIGNHYNGEALRIVKRVTVETVAWMS